MRVSPLSCAEPGSSGDELPVLALLSVLLSSALLRFSHLHGAAMAQRSITPAHSEAVSIAARHHRVALDPAARCECTVLRWLSRHEQNPITDSAEAAEWWVATPREWIRCRQAVKTLELLHCDLMHQLVRVARHCVKRTLQKSNIVP